MREILRVGYLLLPLATAPIVKADTPCKSTVMGDLRIEKFESQRYSRVLTIRVWLPPGYDKEENSSRIYPTLYMLDGQGAFDDCTAFKGERELRLDEAVTKLIEDGEIEPLIVVGIDSGERRDYEYAPYKNPITDGGKPDPIGKQLPDFLAKEMLPHITARYRASKNAGQVGIGGASLGGAAALYTALTRPDLFGLALIQSPSVLLGNGQMLRDTTFIARAPDRVVIGVGSTELDFPDIKQYLEPYRMTRPEAEPGIVKMTEILADHLRAAYAKRCAVLLQVEPGGKHHSRSWAARMPESIKSLYGQRNR